MFGSKGSAGDRAQLQLQLGPPHTPPPHREASLGLAGHTLLGLDLVRVVPHHKGPHGGATAPTVPLDQGQLGEHTAAARHNTPHLDQVAQVPRPVQHTSTST